MLRLSQTISVIFIATLIVVNVAQMNDSYHSNRTLKSNHICKNMLNRYYTIDNIEKVQDYVDCLSLNGEWKRNIKSFPKIACNTKYSTRTPCDTLKEDGEGWKYSWTATRESCYGEIQQYSTEDLCTYMNGESLMIVGDSLSNEFVISLMNQIYLENPLETCKMCSYNCNNTYIIPCNGKAPDFKIFHYRNDRVSLKTEDSFDRHYNFYERPWITELKTDKIKLAVFNRGAHFESNELLLEGVATTMNYLAKNYPDLLVIWRNTPHGHLNSTLFVDGPPEKNPPELLGGPYHWSQFHAENVALRNYFTNNPQLNVIYLDVYNSTVQRRDSHVDGLHYCIPGPTDTWEK